MTLSRWRRVATGIAAGVIVMCAALIGASFRSDSNGVSVASELRPINIIPIEVDPADEQEAAAAADGSVSVIDQDALPDAQDAATIDSDDGSIEPQSDPETAEIDTDGTSGEANSTEAVTVIDPDDLPTSQDPATDSAGTDSASTDSASTESASTESASTDSASTESASTESAGTESASTDSATQPAGDDSLGIGGGVDDAECALDRLVIYGGARVSGIAGSLRGALTQSGFGASCASPVTILASNCPLQFSGVLGAGSGYDPAKSYVASSDSVDRETMTAVMGSLGYTGSSIDILDFGFVNPDQPGEQWVAIFVPPSFDGWETLANRAGIAPSTQSLCAPSGRYNG